MNWFKRLFLTDEAQADEAYRLQCCLEDYCSKCNTAFWQQQDTQALRTGLYNHLRRAGFVLQQNVAVETKFPHALNEKQWTIDLLVRFGPHFVPILLLLYSKETEDTNPAKYAHAVYRHWRHIYQVEKLLAGYKNMPYGYALLMTDDTYVCEEYRGHGALHPDSVSPTQVSCEHHATVHVRGQYKHVWREGKGGYRFLLHTVRPCP
ncbi:MAG: hypothetical protein IJ609_02630 [Paludibacteraceae bacterium]|nr:hypothetical protein [Paludibacteraceae bacterium]